MALRAITTTGGHGSGRLWLTLLGVEQIGDGDGNGMPVVRGAHLGERCLLVFQLSLQLLQLLHSLALLDDQLVYLCVQNPAQGTRGSDPGQG